MDTIEKMLAEEGTKVLNKLESERVCRAVAGKLRALMFTKTNIEAMSLDAAKIALNKLNEILFMIEKRLDRSISQNITIGKILINKVKKQSRS